MNVLLPAPVTPIRAIKISVSLDEKLENCIAFKGSCIPRLDAVSEGASLALD